LDKLQINITDIGYDGEGVGRCDGKVCFAPFTLPGETVNGHVVEEKNSYVHIKVDEILHKVDCRVKPKCKYYGVCGGCGLEHLKYAKQLEYKKMLVERTLKKYAKLDHAVLPVIPSKNEYNYRNKITLFVKLVDGAAEIGLYRLASHEMVDITQCQIVCDQVNDAIVKVRKCIENNMDMFGRVGIRAVMIRAVEDHRQIVFICNSLDVTNNVCQFFDKKDDVFVCKNEKAANITGKMKKLSGRDALSYTSGINSVSVRPEAFLQVNDDVAKKLNKYVATLVDAQVVVNAYSGSGLLSAILAQSAKKVVGIEINKEAHRDAEDVKMNNNITNMTNICGDCGKMLVDVVRQHAADTIVLDPPRAGVGERTMRLLNEVGVKSIIYVSCNPATLARDLNVLTNYSVLSIQPLDMFPQTPNVETVVKLEYDKNR